MILSGFPGKTKIQHFYTMSETKTLLIKITSYNAHDHMYGGLNVQEILHPTSYYSIT